MRHVIWNDGEIKHIAFRTVSSIDFTQLNGEKLKFRELVWPLSSIYVRNHHGVVEQGCEKQAVSPPII